MSINIWVSSQHKVTLSSDNQDRCEGVFGKSSPLYEVHSPQIFENPCCTDSLWDAVFASITASMLCGRCIVSTSKKSTTAVQHHRGQGRCSRARRCCASSPWSFEKFCVTLTLTSNWWTQNALFAYSCQHVCVWAFHSSEISAGRWSFGQMKSCHAVELMNCGKDRSPQPHTDVHSLREYANNVIFFFHMLIWISKKYNVF